MSTITISKKEYTELVDKKLRYEYLRNVLEGDIFVSPPTKSVKKIINAFHDTRKYNNQFLSSLEKGLKKSSYFKK